MSDIPSLRLEIDLIHTQMAELFRRRLLISEKIWELKKSQGLSLIDVHRENALLHQFDSLASNEREKQALQDLVQTLLDINKAYLRKK